MVAQARFHRPVGIESGYSIFSKEFTRAIADTLYPSIMSQMSDVDAFYFAMYRFFDNQIPRNDLLLSYGEGIFQNYTRYQIIRTDISNKNISKDTSITFKKCEKNLDELRKMSILSRFGLFSEKGSNVDSFLGKREIFDDGVFMEKMDDKRQVIMEGLNTIRSQLSGILKELEK